MKYKGSCHCGRVAFEVEGKIETAAVNIRCLEGIDLMSIPVNHFDGRAH
jgi:hypothetical protein